MHKVLFLDDEADLVKDVPLLLKESGLEVTGTTSIPEALRLIAQEEYDAVLLDIMMPPKGEVDAEETDYGRSTGVWVAREMKKIKPKVPIVALSVVWNQKMREQMWEAGISHIINKPAEISQIADTLLRTISRK